MPPKETGHLKTDFAIVEIDDPGFNHNHADGEAGNVKRVKAGFNRRESPVAIWRSKGDISEAQYKAATWFRKQFETSGGAGVSAMDYAAVKVDTSGVSDPIGLYQLEAVVNLNKCRAHLGKERFDLIQKICGELRFLSDLYPVQRQRKEQGEIARKSLDTLAEWLGYQNEEKEASR